MFASELIGEMQQRIGPHETFRRMRRFMVAYLALMQFTLPSVVKKSMEVAAQFDDGSAPPEAIEAARVECWESVDAMSKATNFDDKDYFSLRAAICLLYPTAPDDDLPEVIDWFLDMANKVEDHSAESNSLLQTFFDCSDG
jgi:hypothetical protein